MLGAEKEAQIDALRIAVGTVPMTVPGVVSKATPKGLSESSFTPVSGQVCGAKSTAMWRLISEGRFGLTFRPSRAASCRPKPKAMPDMVVLVVCRPTCAASSEGRCEASRKAGCSAGTSGAVTVRRSRLSM